jgi:hypothetical protein
MAGAVGNRRERRGEGLRVAEDYESAAGYVEHPVLGMLATCATWWPPAQEAVALPLAGRSGTVSRRWQRWKTGSAAQCTTRSARWPRPCLEADHPSQ